MPGTQLPFIHALRILPQPEWGEVLEGAESLKRALPGARLAGGRLDGGEAWALQAPSPRILVLPPGSFAREEVRADLGLVTRVLGVETGIADPLSPLFFHLYRILLEEIPWEEEPWEAILQERLLSPEEEARLAELLGAQGYHPLLAQLWNRGLGWKAFLPRLAGPERIALNPIPLPEGAGGPRFWYWDDLPAAAVVEAGDPLAPLVADKVLEMAGEARPLRGFSALWRVASREEAASLAALLEEAGRALLRLLALAEENAGRVRG